MKISEVLAISGKPGLFKVIASSSKNLVVESMLDSKRTSIPGSVRISSLSDITMYTLKDDVALRTILHSMHKKTKGEAGALSDLEKVTRQAHAMVTVYGLNEKIGNISYYDSRGETTFTKPYSEATAKIIDEEVSAVIERAYDVALDILRKNRSKLKSLAEALLKDEVIYKSDVERILGPRPHEVKLVEKEDSADSAE